MEHFYFVRHGQTVWNVENKICGATDIELTQKGHEQAEETARHISEITGIPMKLEQRLIEQNFGRYEATPRNGAEFHEAKKDMASRFGTGESMLHLAQRIYNLLDEIKSGNKIYILVAHNGIARMVESYFREMNNEEFSSFGIKNCEVKKYEFV